ncbi:MAG: sulfatase-like hydrolase/transferase [Planctomycetaceae bacterium]|nr:sulfatase-like hydrolase/transferase [Planctomycetaceae bacterium]
MSYGFITDVPAGETLRPNIVLILIDDMGWSDLSCFGNNTVKTVNIDRLAQEGISFTQFYVCSPLCSPSRCGITTGQYPQRWRITSYLDNRKRNSERGVAQWLDPSAPVLARFLHQNGYATGHFGKWHLGGQRDVGDAPLITEYGFDESLTNFEGLGSRVLPLLNAFDGTDPRKYALGSDLLGHGEIQWVNRNKVTSSYVTKALEFIKKAEKENKPFYVNLWTDDVHSPFFPSQELRGDGSKKSRYYGVLSELDRQLAPLLDYIRASDSLQKNTLILLLSDNGPEAGAGSSQPFRGSKGMLYEGGIRSPLIVWGNGFIVSEQKGTKNQLAVFQSIDLVPSLLKITGVNNASEVSETIFDGEDFSEILLGRKTDQLRQTPIFWRRPPDRSGTDSEPLPDLALRKGKWKFLMQFDASKQQLYDLEKDVSESINLAGSEPELVNELSRILRDWNHSLPKDAGEK